MIKALYVALSKLTDRVEALEKEQQITGDYFATNETVLKNLAGRLEALEAKAEPKKSAVIEVSNTQPAPEVKARKISEQIRCLSTTRTNSEKCDLRFNNRKDFNKVKNLIERYNAGEIA